MGRLADRFGQFDDRNVIYRTNDPEQRVRWGRLGLAAMVGVLVFAALMAGLGTIASEGMALAVVSIAVLAYLVAYVIWRRRRNRRLTGSSTTWPSP